MPLPVMIPEGGLQTVTYIADENGHRTKFDYSRSNNTGEVDYFLLIQLKSCKKF